jgi:hypothetical protein
VDRGVDAFQKRPRCLPIPPNIGRVIVSLYFLNVRSHHLFAAFARPGTRGERVSLRGNCLLDCVLYCHVVLSGIMDRKRKSSNASSSTPTKKRTTTPRPAKRYRRVTESGGTRVSNVRTNGAKRLQDVKVIKVPNRRAGPGGFTIVATPRARIGDSGVIDG